MSESNAFTVQAKRNDYISFAKAFAIVTIVVYHFCMLIEMPDFLSRVAGLGGGGVHLFIFASGFGLYLSKYSTYKIFLKRRFSKVLYPYYLAVTFIFLFNYFWKIFDDDFTAYLSHIFLFKMFFEKYDTSFGGQFWFISTIIQLYLVYPLLLKVVNLLNPFLCLFGFIVISILYSLTISYLGYGELRVVNSFFIQYLWEFVLGMIVAKKGLIEKVISIKWYILSIIALVAYSVMALLVLNFGSFGKNLNDLFSFIGYFSISVIIFKVVKKSSKTFRAVIAFEKISYPLYLTHTFIFSLFFNFFFQKITLIHLPIIITISFIFAYLFSLVLNKLLVNNSAKNL